MLFHYIKRTVQLNLSELFSFADQYSILNKNLIDFMSKKINFNVAKKNPSESKMSSNPIAMNRKKFQEYIAKTDPVDGVDGIPDEIPPEQIIKYVNMARTNPKLFSTLIKNKLKEFTDEKTRKTPHMLVMSIEGKKAYFQAINFLQNFKPIHALQPNQALMLATMDHCMDLVRNQYLGHVGKDNSQFWDRINRRGQFPGGGAQNCDHVMWYSSLNYAEQTVIRYIIDQGVPSRGHRKNIFNPDYFFIGVSMLKDPKTGYKHAMNFSSGEVKLINSQLSSKDFKYKRGKNWQEKQKQFEVGTKKKSQSQTNQYNYDNQKKPQVLLSKQVVNKKQMEMGMKKKPEMIIKNPEEKQQKKMIFETEQQKPRVINIKLRQGQNIFKQQNLQYKNQKGSPEIFNIPLSYDQMGLPSNSKIEVYTIKNDAVYSRLIDREDKQFNKMWDNLNSADNTINLKSKININMANYEDILGGNISSHFENSGKQIEATTTKTKTMTVNGIKKTEVTKVIKYKDGTEISTIKLI